MQRTSVIPVPSCLVVCLLLSVTAAVSSAQAPPPDRILEAIDPGQTTTLQGNVHPWARAQFDQGRVDPGMEMQGVTIAFKLSRSRRMARQRLFALAQSSSQQADMKQISNGSSATGETLPTISSFAAHLTMTAPC